MDFGFTEEQKMLRDSVRKLMDKHAPPDYIRRLEKDQAYPYELYDEWIKAGILAMPFPESYGGLGGNAIDLAIVTEEIAYSSTDLSMALGGSMFTGLNLVRKATEEQKAYWLPKLLSGEIRMSISMSEPDAGSDVGAMRTTAVRDGNEWVINGQKLWATGAAAKNNVINLYVKTDTKVHYRQGMSLFLVDKDTPGIEMRKLDMLGRRCTGTYEMFLKDVRVPADRLVGGDAGLNKGFDFVLSGLQVERVVSAAGSCGGARAVVDLASSYAKERKQFGKPIGTFQAIAHMLADMETEVEAARSLMLARGMDGVDGPERAQRDHHGQALLQRDLCQGRQYGHAGAGRLRLQQGIRHGAALPRRAGLDRRRRLVADPAQPHSQSDGA